MKTDSNGERLGKKLSSDFLERIERMFVQIESMPMVVGVWVELRGYDWFLSQEEL